jgi:predicted transcriptional regulator
MQITLKPEIEKLIQDEVKNGRSADAGEFLGRAVSHYVLARDLGEAYSPEDVDAMIAEGLDDIDRGDVLDGEESFEHLKAHSAERRRNL